jgi:transcriptional regulator with XRE-family HTH domain
MTKLAAKEIGIRLKTLRRRKKLSLRKVSERAEMDRSNLNKIEEGKKDVRTTTLIRLLKALNATFADLEGMKKDRRKGAKK